MRVRGPNIVRRAVQMDPPLLHYASTKQKKYWYLLAQKFDQFQTSCNNMQKACKQTQHVTTNNGRLSLGGHADQRQ